MIPSAFLIAALAAPPVPAAPAAFAERARYLMGTTCRIAAAHPEPERCAGIVERALDEIARWESILSDYDPGSELSRLNVSAASKPFSCTEDLFGFLKAGASLSRETRGFFDPTVGPLVDLYDLRGSGRWPSPAEISAALARTGAGKLTLDRPSRTARFLASGMRLDPGGLGKGWALDAAARLLRSAGVRWALLDFGGQILAVGGGPDGRGVPVEVDSAGRASPGRCSILLRDASASTSANDERGLVVDGRPLGHILDTRTGRPAAGAASVTVVAPTAARADALSTALFVMGPEAALDAASSLGIEAMVSWRDGGRLIERATSGFLRLTESTCAAEPPAPPAPSPNTRGLQ